MTARALHALNRFGLGRRASEPVPADPQAWLADQLDGPDPALALPATPLAEALVAWREDLKRNSDEIRASRLIMRDDSATALDYAIGTDHPFRERLVWFWANHFTVSLRRGGVVAVANAYLRDAIRPHVTGRFVDMLGAVVRHPAMLFYLDNSTSIGPDSAAAKLRGRGGLNENLARECLELHTVTPAAGYTQADVTAFATLLTGWSVALQRNPPRALFRPLAHQPGSKTVMGQTYPRGAAALKAALGWLARHPATCRNLATKLVRHFVADDPPPAAVARIAAVLAATEGDLRQAALALIELPQAWQPLTKLRSPADQVLAVMRAMDLPTARRPPVRQAMAALGQPFMAAPLPNGWPDTAADWAGPEAMMRRIDWAHSMAARGGGLDPAEVAENALGPLLGTATRREVMRAGSRREALTLLFTSPEFMRR